MNNCTKYKSAPKFLKIAKWSPDPNPETSKHNPKMKTKSPNEKNKINGLILKLRQCPNP